MRRRSSKAVGTVCVLILLSGCSTVYDAVKVAFMKQAPGWIKETRYTNKTYPPTERLRVFLHKHEAPEGYIELAEFAVIENINVSSSGPNIFRTDLSGENAVSDDDVYIVLIGSFSERAKKWGPMRSFSLTKRVSTT